MPPKRRPKYNKLLKGDIVRVRPECRGAAEPGQVGRIEKFEKYPVQGVKVFVFFGLHYASGKRMLMTFSPHQLEPASALDRLAWETCRDG